MGYYENMASIILEMDIILGVKALGYMRIEYDVKVIK